MRSAKAVTRNGSRIGGRVAYVRSWVACCLSRGRRAPLAEKDVDDLVDEFGEQSFAGGTYVFREGDVAARIHVVRTGAIELSRQVAERRVALQILRAGDVFGDVPAFLDEPEPFDARALEDSTVLSLDADALFAMLRTRPHIARRWIVSLADRMSGLHARLGDLLAGGLAAQLASVLLRETADGKDATLTQDQLADMLGVARTSIQRVLKQLEADGLITVGYRRISVTDAGRLEELLLGRSADR